MWIIFKPLTFISNRLIKIMKSIEIIAKYLHICQKFGLLGFVNSKKVAYLLFQVRVALTNLKLKLYIVE
ncbi:unnamed protein product [Meloidogyne enterolobii]|uniref:Uncharacterized protein n=1 Tax=Meloidogyne enterolobii TaxID=390850 RepID=A0ACB0XQC6_MELEN